MIIKVLCRCVLRCFNVSVYNFYFLPPPQASQRQRRASASRRKSYADDDEDEDEMDAADTSEDDGGGQEEEAGPSQRPATARETSRRGAAQKRKSYAEEEEEEDGGGDGDDEDDEVIGGLIEPILPSQNNMLDWQPRTPVDATHAVHNTFKKPKKRQRAAPKAKPAKDKAAPPLVILDRWARWGIGAGGCPGWRQEEAELD